MEDGEVSLVDAVHVAGDRRRHDIRGVAIPDVEHVVSLVLVRADQVAIQWHVVAQERVGDHALYAIAKIVTEYETPAAEKLGEPVRKDNRSYEDTRPVQVECETRNK